jgi:hypothetical protein
MRFLILSNIRNLGPPDVTVPTKNGEWRGMMESFQSRQPRIDDFLSRTNKMALLRQELTIPSQTSADIYFVRIQNLIREVYNAVKSSKDLTGRSARKIALDLNVSYCEDDKDGEFTLECAIQACLIALKSEGHIYPTFDERHFLASVSSFDILYPDLTYLSCKIPALVKEISATISSQNTGPSSSQNDYEVNALKKCRTRSSGNWIQARECGGKISSETLDHYTRKCLETTRNTCLFSNNPGHGLSHSGRGGSINAAEFSPSCEYLLYGCAHGVVTVSKCTGVYGQMREEWPSNHFVTPLPVRQINTKKSIEVVHWTPGNRNEIGVATKSSGEVTIFDLKSSGSLTSSIHSPACILTHRQGQGVGGILDFACVQNSKLVIAGTQSGAVVIWDRRDNKKPRGALRQSNGSVCSVQVQHVAPFLRHHLLILCVLMPAFTR